MDGGRVITVVVYSKKHRQLAADSMTSFGIMKFDTGPKIYALASGAHIACAGDSDVRTILDLFNECTLENLPSKKKLQETQTEFEGILVFPNNKVFAIFIEIDYGASDSNQWAAQLVEIHEDFVALGCGLEFAYGVLEAGGSPKEAAEAACKRSVLCGPPVKVVNIPETDQKKSVKKRVKIDE